MNVWQFAERRVNAFAAAAEQSVRKQADLTTLRHEFQNMLGLPHLDGRKPVEVEPYGFITGEGFTAKRLRFQIASGCWSSGIIFYPEPIIKPRNPAVLYLCGHAEYGLRHYHRAAIMWARRGYICLIVNTLEQYDNHGEHHVSWTRNADNWLAWGCSPAGLETWNSHCALQVLLQDSLVQPSAVGVTGISGGGAVSFYLGLLDERVAAVSSLCGVSSAVDALKNGKLGLHCDCMYPFNLYQRDLSEYAALMAPRPLQLCYGTNDPLFTLEETRVFADRIAQIYRQQQQSALFNLIEAPCGHEEHEQFVQATQVWFDRHLARQALPELKLAQPELNELACSIPDSPNQRIGGWEILPQLVSSECSCSSLQDPVWHHDLPQWGSVERKEWVLPDYRKSRFVGEVEGELVVVEVTKFPRSPKILLSLLNTTELPHGIQTRIARARAGCSLGTVQMRTSCGNFPPLEQVLSRTANAPGIRQHAQRGLSLLGETPVSLQVKDTLAVLNYFSQLPELADCEWYLHGRGEAAVSALHVALQGSISGVLLEDLPRTYADYTPLFGILKHGDLAATVANLAPLKTALVNPSHGNWTKVKRQFEQHGYLENLLVHGDFGQTVPWLISD